MITDHKRSIDYQSQRQISIFAIFKFQSLLALGHGALRWIEWFYVHLQALITMSKPDQKIWRSSLWTKFLCVFGLCVSIYAYHVETSKDEDSSYEALCDVNEAISCTKALNSPYGRTFGILNNYIPRNSPLSQPNSVFGFIFYTLQLILDIQSSVHAAKLQTAFSFISNLGTVYLSYILIYKLKTFCAICVTTYVINAFLLYFTYNKYRWLKSAGQSKRKNKKH